MVFMLRLSAIPDNFHLADHSADSEEPQNFGSHHAQRNELLGAEISQIVQGAWRCPIASKVGVGRKNFGGIAGDVDNGLEEGLEFRQCPAREREDVSWTDDQNGGEGICSRWRHFLSMENNFRHLCTHTGIVDGWRH